MSPHISIKHREHLWCHLILELFFHPKHLYFAMVAGVLAPGMAPVYTSLLAFDICQEKHENIVIKVPKNL